MNHMNKKKEGVIARMHKHSDFLIYSQDTDTKIKLATEVYSKRKSKNLTQQELAKEIKSTQKVISNIESANVSVGIDLLRRLVEALSIDADVLGKILGAPVFFEHTNTNIKFTVTDNVNIMVPIIVSS